MPKGFLNVGVLTVANGFAFAATPMMMLIGSLVGVELAPSTDWATLPIAIMIIGTALAVIPVTRLMANLGRRITLWIFLALNFATCFLASYSLAIASFSLFCLCAAFIGAGNAALQQIRYAAMESVPADKTTTAASIVMLSGVFAAMLGPELAVIGHQITAVDYQGSFWLVAACSLIAAITLLFYTPAAREQTDQKKPTRPLAEIIKNPAFRLAVASGTIGYVVMAFVMTGTPISMHNHFGHSLADTKWVIQSHIAAMFLPSLIAPWLFKLIGIRGMMMAGLFFYSLTIVIGLIDSSVMGFWSQLVMLGIGWNFLFVSGTALLPMAYLSGEQFKAQGFNDSVVFSTQAVASLSAGWAVSSTSWQTTMLICLIPMVFMVVMLLRSDSRGLGN